MTTGINDDNGTLTLEDLDSAVITAMLADEGVGKGAYKRELEAFGKSGAYFIDFCKVFEGKTVKTMIQSVDNNLKALMENPTYPRCKIAKNDEKLLVINLAVHAEKEAARLAAKNES